MRTMGFSFDPGPLPFVTVRAGKWGSRVAVGDFVQIQGEHGCTLPKTPAKVLSITPHTGPAPRHLAHVWGYQRGDKLVDICLAPVDMSADALFTRYGFPV